ncbi:MAG TPA: non-homologous end-joining DNA ligase [Terriglobia bacterium]|nr:non-homologous end-joining DNA ligase [Terriglobia bacterium]
MTDKIPFRVQPMLATLVPKPFDTPGWIYEEKYDGFRILAYKEGASVSLLSRNGKDRNQTYPNIAAAVAKLLYRTLLLDGEVVAFDNRQVSRFQLLQEGKVPPLYAVFDCLYQNGRDLRAEPLSARRGPMEAAIRGSERLFPSHRLDQNGLEAFRVAKTKGYEGMVAKDNSSPYIEGRSRKWLKCKVHQEDEFVIGGYTSPAGSRAHFGALLLGAYQRGQLHYVGKVGTGFNTKLLASLFQKFQPLVRKQPAFVDPPPEKGVTYLAPQLVAQIAYEELTADKKLRQPVFLGLRDDKSAKECFFPGETG